MADALTKFNLQLIDTMKAAQNNLEAINAKGAANLDHAEKEIRVRIASLEQSALKAKSSLEHARDEVVKWVDDSADSVAGWKAKFEVSRLAERADRATKYAGAASQVAVAAVEQAEKAMLDAKLAHAEVDAAKAAKAA
jgi:hypothetical protein